MSKNDFFNFYSSESCHLSEYTLAEESRVKEFEACRSGSRGGAWGAYAPPPLLGKIVIYFLK